MVRGDSWVARPQLKPQMLVSEPGRQREPVMFAGRQHTKEACREVDHKSDALSNHGKDHGKRVKERVKRIEIA